MTEAEDENEKLLDLINKILKIFNESPCDLNSQYAAIQRIRIHLEKHLESEFPMTGIEEDDLDG